MNEITEENQADYHEVMTERPWELIGAIVCLKRAAHHGMSKHDPQHKCTTIEAVIQEGYPIKDGYGKPTTGWEAAIICPGMSRVCMPGGSGQKVNFDDFVVQSISYVA